MTRYCAFGAALAVCAFGTAAAAQDVLDLLPLDEQPFAISLGATFSAPMENSNEPYYDDPLGGLGQVLGGVDTLSATVATGGTTAVSNATAAVLDGDTASSSNGGAFSGFMSPFNSEVSIDGNGFTSSVGTGAGIRID